LLSGGADSTTALYIARTQYAAVEAISINYGQRNINETGYAKHNCERLNIPHQVINVGSIMSGVMLTNPQLEIPDIKYSDISGVSPMYVPFRNGVMLSVITSIAQKWVDDVLDGGSKSESDICGIYFGAHTDAHSWAYPDCTPEFIGAMANAIYIGSYRTIRLHTPVMWLEKWQIIRWGAELGVPYEDTFSCYRGERIHCGKCVPCYSRRDAFIRAGVRDPTTYAQ
ncbi:MAG: 7-cyano-7-deazaguanine synthase, partial [Anaerolineae bacterium]|nr:7-cyano-7-deazaguanine synthase [Anaerolineae bacterium]